MHQNQDKKWYYPTWITKSITDLDPISLKSHGVKAVITDLDNTLVAWDIKDSDLVAKRWIASLKDALIPVIVVSNNKDERVKKAVANLGIPYISFALKPAPWGIKRAIKKLNLNRNDVILVGDQVMTDLFAGKSAGVRTVLVQPLVNTDSWNTKINRVFEKPIMKKIKQAKGIEWKIK